VLGRNCRFIQGPETDVEEVAKIRKAISEGVDVSVLLLNYHKDGTTFWNQVHCAALRNEYGEIVNYVGVQCQVNPNVANAKAMTSSSSTTSLKSLGSGVGQSFDGDFDDDDDEDDDDDNGA
jgi:arabinogalactan endo-1,4-beta-galactosidase